jgi:hypothetical protein
MLAQQVRHFAIFGAGFVRCLDHAYEAGGEKFSRRDSYSFVHGLPPISLDSAHRVSAQIRILRDMGDVLIALAPASRG